jgi:hypothetical protein
VIEIDDVATSLLHMVVRGALGVYARGWNAEVSLIDVEIDVSGGDGVGIAAARGAQVRLFEGAVHGGVVGIEAYDHGSVNVQRSLVTGSDTGVALLWGSAAITDSTIEGNHSAGLSAGIRSDVNVFNTTFRDNGQVHVSATDWSKISLNGAIVLGTDTDPTGHALGTARGGRIASYSAAVIHGDVSALDGGSLRIGNTVVEGDVIVALFSDAEIRNAETTGSVVCQSGAQALCTQPADGGAFGCPSTSCGEPTAAAADRAPGLPEVLVLDPPRIQEPPHRRMKR